MLLLFVASFRSTTFFSNASKGASLVALCRQEKISSFSSRLFTAIRARQSSESVVSGTFVILENSK
jgi:hypothetical protein